MFGVVKAVSLNCYRVFLNKMLTNFIGGLQSFIILASSVGSIDLVVYFLITQGLLLLPFYSFI